MAVIVGVPPFAGGNDYYTKSESDAKFLKSDWPEEQFGGTLDSGYSSIGSVGEFEFLDDVTPVEKMSLSAFSRDVDSGPYTTQQKINAVSASDFNVKFDAEGRVMPAWGTPSNYNAPASSVTYDAAQISSLPAVTLRAYSKYNFTHGTKSFAAGDSVTTIYFDIGAMAGMYTVDEFKAMSPKIYIKYSNPTDPSTKVAVTTASGGQFYYNTSDISYFTENVATFGENRLKAIRISIKKGAAGQLPYQITGVTTGVSGNATGTPRGVRFDAWITFVPTRTLAFPFGMKYMDEDGNVSPTINSYNASASALSNAESDAISDIMGFREDYDNYDTSAPLWGSGFGTDNLVSDRMAGERFDTYDAQDNHYLDYYMYYPHYRNEESSNAQYARFSVGNTRQGAADSSEDRITTPSVFDVNDADDNTLVRVDNNGYLFTRGNMNMFEYVGAQVLCDCYAYTTVSTNVDIPTYCGCIMLGAGAWYLSCLYTHQSTGSSSGTANIDVSIRENDTIADNIIARERHIEASQAFGRIQCHAIVDVPKGEQKLVHFCIANSRTSTTGDYITVRGVKIG